MTLFVNPLTYNGNTPMLIDLNRKRCQDDILENYESLSDFDYYI